MFTRIFIPLGKPALFIHALTIFVVVYYVTIFFVRVCICIPTSAFWDGGGHCLNLDVVWILDTFISLITDGAILALPVFLVWNLKLSLGKKIKVTAILGAGGLAIVSNIYRLYLVWANLGTMDTTFYTIHLLFTGYVDIYPHQNFILVSLINYAV